MFSIIKGSRKAAAAERIFSQEFGCSIPTWARKSIHATFKTVIKTGGSEYDAATAAALISVQMVIEGPLAELGLKRTQPMSDEQSAAVISILGKIRESKSKSKLHTEVELDDLLDAFLATVKADGAASAAPGVPKSQAELFVVRVVDCIDQAIFEEFSSDDAAAERVRMTFHSFLALNTIGSAEEIAVEYIKRGYSVEDAALLFFDGTTGAFLKPATDSPDMHDKRATSESREHFDRVVDRLFFAHVKRTAFPTIIPRYGKASRSLDAYMKEPG